MNSSISTIILRYINYSIHIYIYTSYLINFITIHDVQFIFFSENIKILRIIENSEGIETLEEKTYQEKEKKYRAINTLSISKLVLLFSFGTALAMESSTGSERPQWLGNYITNSR